MSNNHLNDGTILVCFRVPENYADLLNQLIELNGITKKQYLISHIDNDLNGIEKKKELLKAVSNFKDAMFFLKAYTTLDKDRKRARKVLDSLNGLDKVLSDVLINFS